MDKITLMDNTMQFLIKPMLKGILNFFKSDDFETIDHYYKQDHIEDKQKPSYVTGVGKLCSDECGCRPQGSECPVCNKHERENK